jgi:3-phenylpropionate/trans-cinnamate dioxygenase ferredoxin reductase component
MHYKYLIIGGGMTADSAVKGIREVSPEGTIGLFSSDTHPPYDRPPLTKGLWKGDEEESVWRGTESQGVTLHLGRTIRHIDPQNKIVTDDEGADHTFDRLLLATGVSARKLDFGGTGVIHYRTFDDYKRLRALAETGQRFGVIGGGFIGSELAAALTMNDKEAVIAFPGTGIGGNLFPSDLSAFLNDYYREKGVEVHPNTHAYRCDARNGKQALGLREADTKKEWEVLADGVIAGIGTVPNVELAEAAGLEVDNGIRVNASLQTSHADIFAAGDVASFHDPVLNEWRRVEHEDNANTMGAFAGRAMAGEIADYSHLPFFYSDLFDLGYEAVGDVDSRLETFSDWKDPFREGVVYYLRDGHVRGVLLWNVWDQVGAARELIAKAGPFKPEELKGRLPV